MEGKEKELTYDELLKLVEQKDKRIEELELYAAALKAEQEEMIANFKSSTNLLIERLKTEAEAKTGIRPQTAQLLSNNRPSLYGDSNFFTSNALEESIKPESMVDKGPPVKCHCCGKMFPERTLKKHTVICYRSVVKCKGCGEFMLKAESKDHLKPFRDSAKIKAHVMNGDLNKLQDCLKHEFKVDTPFPELYDFTLLHMAVEAKSTALVDLLATAKANPDAVDVDGNTPLALAITSKLEKVALQILEKFPQLGVNVQYFEE